MMRLPVIQGVIDRRILVNYRLDAEVARRILPPPFEPKLIRGQAIGGICLIRLKQVRPRGLPGVLGMGSENAAHRLAVTWKQNGQRHEGVYVPRRDTDSRLNASVGGRIFPGTHHHARFEVDETDTHYHVRLRSDDDASRMEVSASRADTVPSGSIFRDLTEASDFFEAGALGYSATADPNRYDGLELQCKNWSVTPLEVQNARTSYFDDSSIFPSGSVQLDCALLMRDIEHEWHSSESLRCRLAGEKEEAA